MKYSLSEGNYPALIVFWGFAIITYAISASHDTHMKDELLYLHHPEYSDNLLSIYEYQFW